MLIFYTCPECGGILFHRNPDTTDGDLFFHCQNCGIDIDPCEMTGKSSNDLTPEEINSAIAELTSAAMSDKSPTQLLTNPLPQNITLTRDVLADKLGLNENQTLLDIEHEQLIDVINEYLSDQYEVCPTGFATDIHENEIELTDIEWDLNDN